MRVRAGVGLLVLGLGLVVALVAHDAPRAWRAVVLLPFVAAGITLVQVRHRTCVVFAARGVKDLDSGEVPVTDARELEQLKRQARLVYVQGVGLGLLLTLVVMAVR